MVSEKRIHDRIVVGVDGSTASHQAVMWAAAEARLRHADLIVTHVEPAGSGAGWTQDRADVDRHELLAASATAASTRQPGVAVGTLLISGDISDQLIQLSRSAGVLVVGIDRAVSRAAHGATGPIEDRVVAHAWCPVVLVAERLPVHEAAHDCVLVGLTADEESVDVLNAAAAEAVLRRADLRVLIGRAEGSGTTEPDGAPGGFDTLEQSIATLGQAQPRLTVTSRHVGERLVDELERESRRADLMVIGCAQSEDRWSIRTGALSSAMVRQSHCPVMLVGQRVGRRATASQPAA